MSEVPLHHPGVLRAQPPCLSHCTANHIYLSRHFLMSEVPMYGTAFTQNWDTHHLKVLRRTYAYRATSLIRNSNPP